MDYTKLEEIVTSYQNGNIAQLVKWVRSHSKIDMLDLIECAQGMGVPRHMIINTLRNGL